MATTAPKVSFPEGVKVPAPPAIVAAGAAKFNQQGAVTVTLPRAIEGGYIVLVTGDGYNAGAIAPASTAFSVRNCTPTSFLIVADDSRCRQAVGWVAVSPL